MRKSAASSPIAKPIVATKMPMPVNDSARPPASARGPRGCSPAAVPSTIGISGRTQGDSTESTPASAAKVSVAAIVDPQSAASSIAMIPARLASPTSRAISRPPANRISVLCRCAPNARTASTWLSKSMSSATMPA